MNKEKFIKKWGYKAITQQYQKLIDKLLLQDLDQLTNKVCKWTEDEDYGSTYNTECGEMWSFTEDGVVENKVHYCFHCGGQIEVIKAIRED